MRRQPIEPLAALSRRSAKSCKGRRCKISQPLTRLVDKGSLNCKAIKGTERHDGERYIRRARHSDDPDLGAATLAAKFNCSPRYVHRLFAGTGCSVGEHVNEKRILVYTRSSLDRTGRRRTIAEIAFAWFRDVSHFNRLFKVIADRVFSFDHRFEVPGVISFAYRKRKDPAMAAKAHKPAGGWPTPATRCRAQSAAGLHAARPDGNLESSQSEIETVDRANVPVHREISFGPFRLLPTRRLLLERDKPVHLGARALDLLVALVERPGELVSKSELIEKVWPRTIVVEGNLKLHIAALRRVLSDGQADNRYISTITGRGYCFVAPITQSAGPGTAAARRSEPLSNLPAPLMRLIGREESIGRLSTLLTHHRLITLVGPGGIGKTSVAVATANGLSDSYEHGVWFVDLTTISDPRLLPGALGSAIRLDTSVADPVASLLSFLRDKRMLLVLDNCEHIVEASAALAFQALRAGPGVQILATSREPLGVEGERLHRLQSLELPTVLSSLSAQQALDFSAIQLFVERAANVLGDFKLRDADVSMVIEICRKLDGIPLAIELAAATIDALGLGGIVSRLDHPLRLPATRSQTATPRHQTLRSAMDWSYRLLSEEEQRALRQLSVFTDTFTMDAATSAVAGRTYLGSEGVDLVVALVAKSLVAVEPNGSDTRLRLLATTRAYALERLAERRKLEAIAGRQTRFSQHRPRAAEQRNQAASPV